MILSAILVVLLAAVTIRQAQQGLFSALITAALAVCCAALALGTHEYVASNYLASWLSGWNPDYAFPIAVGVLFGVPLLLLRLLFDKLVHRAALLPAWVDRIGGGICGLITAFVTVGMVAIALRMIPFDQGSILGYAAVPAIAPEMHGDPDQTVPESEDVQDIWLSPDRFVAGLMETLSGGVFSGSSRFHEIYPDLVGTLAHVNAAHAEVSRYAPPDSISVVGTWPVDVVYRFTPGNERAGKEAVYDPEHPRGGETFRVVRVRLTQQARDMRKSHVFRLWQFRLVGRVDEEIAQEHPVAIQQADATQIINRHVKAVKKARDFWPVTQERFSPRNDHPNEVEVVFEIPQGFEPEFIEYKRLARAPVTFKEDRPVAERRSERPERPSGSTTGGTSAGEGRSTDAGRPAPEPSTAEPPPTEPERVADASEDSRRGRRRPAPPPERPTRRRRPPAPEPEARGGRVRGATVSPGQSRFGDELPVRMTSYTRLKSAEIDGEKLVSGHLVGLLDEQADGTMSPLVRFDVPGDKRLLHLASIRLDARSTLGRALSQAVTTLQNYFVEDEQGRRYKIVGKYAIASVNGQDHVEVQYFPEPTGSMGGLGDFQRIDEEKLTRNDVFALVFLVEPGAKIVRFSTGGSATRAEDLRDENLIAPE